MQAPCNNKLTFSCKCFLVGFKAVSEPPVLEQHAFQALTLELTLDLNKKKCIIVISDEISIIVSKSYNDMYEQYSYSKK